MADPRRMVALVREQAEGCAALGSPLYAFLLQRVADDVESGGPAYDVLRGHEDDPGPSALALRLMGGVHRLVLERRAPALALTYPSVGGTGDPAAAWAALRPVLSEFVEIGTSAGLNLRADRFWIELADGRAVGPAASPVVLTDAWQGRLPPLDRALVVVERTGCDLAPVDPTTTEGRLLLTSYVWPDQLARLARLRGALELARDVPAAVVAAPAGDFLDRVELREGSTTVVWHSVMWQYLDAAEQDRVLARLGELGAQASDRAGFAHLALEPRRRARGAAHEFLVTLQSWPGGAEQVLGRAEPHGLPTTWEIP